MKRTGQWMTLFVICLALSGAGFSQASSSSLRGTVTDSAGNALPDATVIASNPDLRITRTATTGGVGDYSFQALPPGTYTLTVTAAGFTRYQQTGIQLLVNTPATANVQLKVGGAAETVTVTGEAPALNLVDASIGNPFNETQVKQIPLEGRNVPDLLSLQAGVAYTGNRSDNETPEVKDQDSRSGSVNGARSDQSNITLDGVDVNDQSHGYAFTSVLPVTLDSVQEFRVTTSNYNSDQGGGSGAQVALITKSGTNKFHGSLYEYNRNTFFSASDYLLKQPLKLNRNIFGVSVGGPIQKDRVFFFANYEGTRRREASSAVRSIPTPSMCAGNLSYYAYTNNDPTQPIVTQTLSASQLQGLDPWTGPTPGINSAIENAGKTGYFDTTFCTGKFKTNDTSVGDGLNYSGYRFGAPIKDDNNAFIARLDYHLTSDGKQTLFWRGALQNEYNPEEPFLPGSPPMMVFTDHSKGFAFGYTAVLGSSKVNSFRWGFTRQSQGFLGNTNQEWNVFYGLDQGINYTHNAQTPVHDFVDDFTWTKGAHTLQMGANIGIARNPRVSYEHSFSVGKGATNWMSPTGFANTAIHDQANPLACGPIGSSTGGSPLDPCHGGYPEPVSTPQFDYPIMAMFGMVSDVIANYNYDKNDNVLNPGVPISRKYGLNWYEFYGQDSWRMKSNLTVTYGVRWSLFPPPWEVNGFQASPTCDPAVNDPAAGGVGCPSWSYNLGTEFAHNAQAMTQGIGYDATPLVSFILGGPGNPGPGFYHFEKSDFSPRVSFAYSPRPSGGWLKSLFGDSDKTVIRGGFSKVYDRAGMQLLSTFDANAPGGLAATVQNPCCAATDPTYATTNPYDTADGVPRITDINQVPTSNIFGLVFKQPNPQSGPFPQAPAPLGQAITWGIDQAIKTPYAYAFDFSIGRELPNKFSLQLTYVNRLGRNLLTQRDLRQPIDLYDPQSGVDYFSAATALAKVARGQLASGGINPAVVTDATVDAAGGKPTSAFWHHMISPLVDPTSSYANLYTPFVATPGPSGLISAIYDLYYDPFLSYVGNEVVGLGYTDIYYGLTDNTYANYYGFNGPACNNPVGVGFCPGTALNNQATSMFAWSSVGKSNYNGLQISLRKQMSQGLQFDLNYTYSKSLDYTSGATRLGYSSSTNVGAPGSRLANAFSPQSRYAVSDFDTTNQINANWIAELPFGKGRHFATNAGPAANAIIGGWELSGVARWTSGFPFSVDNGNFWSTNWDEQGIAQMLVKPKTGRFMQPGGAVGVFPNPSAAWADFQNPYPGQAGSRNVIRGDGFAGLDMALNKRWTIIEGQSLQFRWEVFNVPNLHRFNVDSGLQSGAACGCIASMQDPFTFGDYTGLSTANRVMQFALRYEF